MSYYSNNIQTEVVSVMKNKENNRVYRWFTGRKVRATALFLAGVVTFSTTYALILPAITLEEDRAEDDPAIVFDV